jgi:hypothetical protein
MHTTFKLVLATVPQALGVALVAATWRGDGRDSPTIAPWLGH